MRESIVICQKNTRAIVSEVCYNGNRRVCRCSGIGSPKRKQLTAVRRYVLCAKKTCSRNGRYG